MVTRPARARTWMAPVFLAVLSWVAGCGGEAPPPASQEEVPDPTAERTAFWSALEALCGQAFEGVVVRDSPPAAESPFAGVTLTMHVRECSPEEIRIPFHVGDDRSRTWVLTRLPTGFRLKHHHLHEDGTPDAVHLYGGDTRDPGTGEWQEFPADAFTAELLPAAATNVWTVEVVPGEMFAYALRREGTDRAFRVEFDLSRPVTAPPAPWGG
jgi:hypothetical protein